MWTACMRIVFTTDRTIRWLLLCEQRRLAYEHSNAIAYVWTLFSLSMLRSESILHVMRISQRIGLKIKIELVNAVKSRH